MRYHMNAYMASDKIPDNIPVGTITLNEQVKNPRAVQQIICNKLNRVGIAASVASIPDQKRGIDIYYFSDTTEKIRYIIKKNVSITLPEKRASNHYSYSIAAAWQNYVRIHLLKSSHIQVGKGIYVSLNEISKSYLFKAAFIIQTELYNGHPVIWIKPKYRYMARISEKDVERAENQKVLVRVLPSWSKGRIKGFGLWKSNDTPSSYWKQTHQIDFVSNDDLIVEVEFESKGAVKSYNYPLSCVFKEFEYGIRLPKFLKIHPSKRVSISSTVLPNFNRIVFLGQTLTFQGPISIDKLGYKHRRLPQVKDVILTQETGRSKKNITVLWDSILKELGNDTYPYSGLVNTDYIVMSPNGIKLDRFFTSLRSRYTQLNLGEMNPFEHQDSSFLIKDGILWLEDDSFDAYENAAINVQQLLSEINNKVIIFTILPEDRSGSEVYYGTRRVFFDPLLSSISTLPTQSIQSSTIETYNKSLMNPILDNIVGQVYIKAGGIGKVPWILAQPADSSIPGLQGGGVTCYSYFDVSRRTEHHTQASVFSALTDPYGQYIDSGNFPSGTEKLEPFTAYNMIITLLRKIMLYTNQKKKGLEKFFQFKRLSFSKDGLMYDTDVEVLRKVFHEGIPDQKRKPIKELLGKTPYLPPNLVVDLIGVNKSPKREIFVCKDSSYENVSPGTLIETSDHSGLLVTSKTRQGTCIPIELSLKEHMSFNITIQKPTISQIAQEYYNLTFLNWNSLYHKGKYALPQKITQAIGENLTKGVPIPENYIPL